MSATDDSDGAGLAARRIDHGGVPGQVVDVEGQRATLDFWGVRLEVRLDLGDVEVRPGDYLISYDGVAVRRLDDDELFEALAPYQSLLGRPFGGEPPR